MRLLLAAALMLAGCGPAPTVATGPRATATVAPTATPNFDDMMGAAPAATVFVVSGPELLAVTLLNHAVRYRITLSDDPQVATSPDGARLFVADRTGTDLRLRSYDVVTGQALAQTTEPLEDRALVETGSARGAIAVDAYRLLVLRHAATGLLVHAYDAVRLIPVGTPTKNDGCATRLLASAAEYALVCPAGEGIYLFWDENGRQQGGIAPIAGPLAGAAMWQDGKIASVHAFGDLRLVRARGTAALALSPNDWVKTAVGLDGLAWADQFTLVVAESDPAVARPRIHVIDTTTYRTRRFDLPSRPANGILAFGQFAYWVAQDASGVYHVDLQSGLVEKMYGPLEKGASLGALAVR